MTPNALDMLKVKHYQNMHHTYTLEARIFVRFSLLWALSSYEPILWKVHQKSPTMTMPCSRLKVHPHTPSRPKFSSFCSTMSRFGVTSQFCEKCTTRLQNDLDIPKVKSTHLHTTHTHPRPKFHYIRSTTSYGPILVKVHRMTPRWPWHVQGQWYLYVQEIHPRDPIFCPSR